MVAWKGISEWSIPENEITQKVKFGGTLGTLKVTFLDGFFAGNVYKIPCDRIVVGKAVIYSNTLVRQVVPIENNLTLEDSCRILNLIKPYSHYVEVR